MATHKKINKIVYIEISQNFNFAAERDSAACSGGFSSFPTSSSYPARVTISCPEKAEVAGKLVPLPKSLEELLNVGAGKYGFSPIKILTKEGAEIDDIDLIRDGDHLILVSDNSRNQMAEEPRSKSHSGS